MLLDKAPTVVTVYPAIDVDDGYGGLKPGIGAAVVIRAFAQPMQRTEAEEGYADSALYKLIFKPCPITRWAYVEFDGQRFSVIDHPRLHKPSVRTQFMTVLVSKRGEAGGVRQPQA